MIFQVDNSHNFSLCISNLFHGAIKIAPQHQPPGTMEPFLMKEERSKFGSRFSYAAVKASCHHCQRRRICSGQNNWVSQTMHRGNYFLFSHFKSSIC